MAAYNKMGNRNTRKNEKDCKYERKEAHKLFRQERKYCLNQHSNKRKLLITTMRQRKVISK